MKANIKVTQGSYGFGHEWTLECETKTTKKSFYLGQDVKFCSRVLGMDGADVVRAIGTNRLDTEIGTRKLARFIVNTLQLNGRNIKNIEAWELCCQ
jgi:predicted thioesterase